MKTRNLIALSALVSLSSLSPLGAAQKDEAAGVLASYRQLLAARDGTDSVLLEQIAGLITEETVDPGALTDILRQLYPKFPKALEAAAISKNDEGIQLLRQLTEDSDPYLAAESAYFLGRTLMGQQRLEEALPVFTELQKDHPDHSLRIGEAVYYQGVCQANSLQRKEASMSLNNFVERYPDAPKHLLVKARGLLGQMEGTLDGSLDDVADHMDFSTNKLVLVDAGERTQEVQDEIITMLDELIRQAEESPP